MNYIKGTETKITPLNVINLKGDMGATFANVATELAKYVFDNLPVFAYVENTNGTGAGARLYMKGNEASGWKYVALS